MHAITNSESNLLIPNPLSGKPRKIIKDIGKKRSVKISNKINHDKTGNFSTKRFLGKISCFYYSKLNYYII